MAFLVDIAPAALLDIEETYLYILEQSGAGARAAAWYNGLFDALLSLEEMPTRCPLAPESADIGVEVRQLLYKRHRILFAVLPGDVVRVFRVWHGARDRLQGEDLE